MERGEIDFNQRWAGRCEGFKSAKRSNDRS